MFKLACNGSRRNVSFEFHCIFRIPSSSRFFDFIVHNLRHGAHLLTGILGTSSLCPLTEMIETTLEDGIENSNTD